MKNQIEQSNFIKNKFSIYLKSTFEIRDKEYNELYLARLKEMESGLYKGPYLSSSLPFEQSKSLNDLIDEGIFQKDFRKLGSIDFNRPNYTHQINAFNKIKNGKNIVVTTGTGSGKTECFLLPILDEIIKEINSPNYKPGVRAIFLFPLNALVYDQIDRLRNLLISYPKIRFGFYTGRTPEDSKSEEGKKLIGLYKKKYGEKIENEVLTREEMRENPPEILFTNYSMLEYLLIRPTDQSLISPDGLNKLRFIVLDEAHIYRGALGIEISLLLRRLLGTCQCNPQFALTSATLGKGVEDLPKIIDFAHKLTSKDFDEDDVIFGTRVTNILKPQLRIEPEDYILMYKNLENTNEFIKIFNKYYKFDNSQSIKSNLYYLLSADYGTYELYLLTKNVSDFGYTRNSLQSFDNDSLTALIELISKATSNDSEYPLKLFDVKYHMFMKAPDGSFITLGNHKDLSLLTVNYINGYKAFKIGICQNCKTPFIMGITENNILSIDDEIDIDESYASKAKRLEYYLIKDCLSMDEIEQIESSSDFEKYYLCAKCGFIKKANAAVSSADCDHLSEEKVVVYKFVGKDEQDLDDDDVVTNNLHRCPICEYKTNNGGVVMGFHVGKDRATTLISQILYESMEYPKIKIKAQSNSLVPQKDEIKNGRKQFLAFSDSRQQAAFFSKFLNSNNKRFEKKILIWNELIKNNHACLSYDELINKLKETYQRMFHKSDDEAEKESTSAALWELLLVDGRNSGEGIGLFAFIPYLPEIYYNDDFVQNFLSNNGFQNVTPQMFRDLTSIVISGFRKMPAVQYNLPGLDYEAKKEMLGYRQKTYNFIKQATKKKKGDSTNDKNPIKSFLPAEDEVTKKSSVNKIVKFTKKAFNIDITQAKKLLGIVYDTLTTESLNLTVCMNDEVLNSQDKEFRIKSSIFKIHSCQNLKFYRCKKCKKLTLYNINNKCTEADCCGELEEIDITQDPLIVNNYYRNEYITRPAEELICAEHTAQLNAKQAQKFQEDFKDQKINFISCSTTFEMGIDLGGLNTVFMRNVPPTPANYAQRAGRAGRRSDTSAFILTFCGSSSHDYTFFEEPSSMIKGLVNTPYFVLDNEKILLRHIAATALSIYFREPEYTTDFDTVTHFLENDVATKFIAYIKSKPIKLGNLIDNYLLTEPALLSKYGDFKWINYISESESNLKKMKDGLESLIQLYQDAKHQAWLDHDSSAEHSYEDALERMNTKNSLITSFTSYNVIPGYGFPIDNVELYIYDFDKEEMSDEYNLSRNMAIAISEYAPSSEIIVNEKKYTSRYLRLPYKNYHLPETFYCECEKCHTINTSQDKKHFTDGVVCEYCGEKLNVSGTNVKHFLTPIYGFIADRQPKNTERIKPFKTYASDTYYIGSKLSQDASINDVVEITEHENEKLLVLNDNNFYFCPSCGYTDLDRKNQNSTKIVDEHHEYNGKLCKCGKPLEKIHLGYSYITDIIQINFKNIKEMEDEETALSVLYAILEGISMASQIEREDISGMIYSINASKPFSLILFDTVPGGAGHVKRLKEQNSFIDVVDNAIKKVSQHCCDEDASCYHCLRTYNNQRFHKHLKRGLALKALLKIKSKMLSNNKEYYIQGPSISFKTSDPTEFLSYGKYKNSLSLKPLENLFHEIQNQGAQYPDGYGYKLTVKNEENIYYADFIYEKEKKLLFSIEKQSSYEILKNTQNKYECILLTESFDYVGFVKGIKE